MMAPGEVYPITVELFPTSNLFAAGHRIRLDIASSNFLTSTSTRTPSAPEGTGQTTRIATNTVYVDAARPSHIVLPVIPAG
ncbi:MAG: CocE/NonD family hydrolase C-terminal non-catalytic domain-containing protein [Dehalococcoidia bacterium]